MLNVSHIYGGGRVALLDPDIRRLGTAVSLHAGGGYRRIPAAG